jgi:hypothetical protein
MRTFNLVSKKNLKCLLALSIISLIIYSCTQSNGDGDLYELKHGIYYLELDGSPSQMGKRHGLAFKGIIPKVVDAYKQNVYEVFGEENGKAIIDWALTKAGFTNDLKEYLPRVYEEIAALAKAAELPVEDILLINMNEEIFFAGPVALNIAPKHSLSPVGTVIQIQTDDREKLCAQNVDCKLDLSGQQLMIRYQYPDREILIYTFVGRVGGIGVNDKGLSVLAAKLPQGKNRQSDGLGLNYTLRLVLEQDNVDKALARLKRTRKFSAYSYALGDYEKSVITEESGDNFVSSPMLQYPGFQCHTNHMLWIESQSRIDLAGAFENGEPLDGVDSFYTTERLEQAKAVLLSDLREIDDDRLRALLTTPNINSDGDMTTMQSAIIEYDEEEIDMIISAGADPERKWNRYDF